MVWIRGGILFIYEVYNVNMTQTLAQIAGGVEIVFLPQSLYRQSNPGNFAVKETCRDFQDMWEGDSVTPCPVTNHELIQPLEARGSGLA